MCIEMDGISNLPITVIYSSVFGLYVSRKDRIKIAKREYGGNTKRQLHDSYVHENNNQ